MDVKWVPPSQLVGSHSGLRNETDVPVLTLDGLEKWLKDEEKSRVWKTPDQVFSNILAQVRERMNS